MNRFQKYLAAILFGTILTVPAALRADCPDGGRTTSEAERQAYMEALNSLKDMPPAPAGGQLQLPRYGYTEAPTNSLAAMLQAGIYESRSKVFASSS